MGLVRGCPENVRAPTIYSGIGRKLWYYVVHPIDAQSPLRYSPREYMRRVLRPAPPESGGICRSDSPHEQSGPKQVIKVCGRRIQTWHEYRQGSGAKSGAICRARSHIQAPSPCVSTAGTSLGSEAPRHPSSRGLEPSAAPAAQVWGCAPDSKIRCSAVARIFLEMPRSACPGSPSGAECAASAGGSPCGSPAGCASASLSRSR
jgi:hypothetical protein